MLFKKQWSTATSTNRAMLCVQVWVVGWLVQWWLLRGGSDGASAYCVILVPDTFLLLKKQNNVAGT